MFNQMVRIWIAIPFIMFFLVITGLAADFMYRVVEENYVVVSVIVLIISLSGLIAAMYKWLK